MYATIGFPYAYSAFLVYILPLTRMKLNKSQLQVVEQMVILTNLDLDLKNISQWIGPLQQLHGWWQQHISEAALCHFFQMSGEEYRKEVSTGYFWATMGNTKPSNCIEFWTNFFNAAVTMIPMIEYHYGTSIPQAQTQAFELYNEAAQKYNEQRVKEQYAENDVNTKAAYANYADNHLRREVQLFAQVCGLTNAILAITEAINASLPPPNPPALNDANRQYVLGMFWQRVHPLFGRLQMMKRRDNTTRLAQMHFTLDQLVDEVCTSANLNQALHLFLTDIQTSPQTQFLVAALAQQIETKNKTGFLSDLSYVPEAAAAAVPSPQSSAAVSAQGSPVQSPQAARSGPGSPVSAAGLSGSAAGSPVAGLGSPVAGSPVAGLSGSPGSAQGSQPRLTYQSFGPQSGYSESGFKYNTLDGNGMNGGSKKTRTKRSAHKRSAHKHKRSAHKRSVHKRSVHKHKRSAHKHK